MTTQIIEIHTGDLTATCPRSVQLRHENKVIRIAGEALYKGQLIHKMLEIVHVEDRWFEVDKILPEAVAAVMEGLKVEKRPLSASCVANQDEYNRYCAGLVSLYCERFVEEFAGAELLGVEVPCRLTLIVDDEPQEFASHVDLVFIDSNGQTCIWDWKSQEEAPTRPYLDRNLQLGLYYLMANQGSMLIGGEWQTIGQPLVSWIHMRDLAPYSRAGKYEDESGKTTEYKRGDTRPRRRIVRDVMHINEAAIIEELTIKTRMFRAGLFPTNPTPVGCMTCDSVKHCPHFCKEDTNVSH